ncbi:MAG: adenylate/guanylate cyclase domain-containing protein [Actinomycetota bacterium]
MPTVSNMEEFAAAGLYPGDGDPDERRALLEWLSELGFTVEQLSTPIARDNLAAIASDYRIVPGERMSQADAAARAGLDPERFDQLATAFGFVTLDHDPPGDRRFTTDEIELFSILASLTSIFSHDEAVSVVRVIGSSFARLGEAFVSMFLVDVESPHMRAGDTELMLAHKIYDATALLDGLTARLDPVLRRHVLQAIERGRHGTVGVERLLYRNAIAFVDLVGFTPVSSDLDAPELATFLREFEGEAHDVATRCGARLVKVIGDEVMFAAPDANAACLAASTLMAGFGAGSTRVVPRAGVAFGDVLTRSGDYYGAVVNLASRLVDHAVPGEVLVTEAVTVAATDCRFDVAGRRVVKGFDDPVAVWTLRPQSASS